MDELIALVGEFRSEMDCAFRKGLFSTDIVFKRFPKGCCGDTCYLLAEFLKEHCFHRKFVFDFAHDYNSLEDGRLYSLYNKIMMNRDTQP